MNKLGFILSIVLLMNFTWADEVGCTDQNACNFDPEAITDDGSCEYPEEFYDCESNCLNDSDEDLVCDELEIIGCTDESACNFNENATEDDGNCEYPTEEYLDCDSNCLNDIDGDLVCDELEIIGCMEENSCDFDPLATDPDECDGSPGILTDLNVITFENENKIQIEWTQPCGLGNIFAYYIVGDIDGEDVSISISSPYILDSLSWSTSYSLNLSTQSEFGESLTPFQFEIGPESIPEKVENLSITPGEANILLNWSSTAHASSYNIYKDEILELSISADDTSYISQNLYTSTNYTFSVSATNSEGYEGEISDEITSQVIPMYGVTEFETISDAGLVSFIWGSPQPYAEDSNYTFTIFDGNDNVLASEFDGNEITIDGLEDDEESCIRIIASHQYGDSMPSDLICENADIPPAIPVEGLLLSAGEGEIVLNWMPHPQYPYFSIYRNGELIVENQWFGFGAGSYTDINLLASSINEYIVLAINPNGVEGEAHEPVSTTVLPLPTVENFNSESSNGRVILHWSPPELYADSGFTYEVVNIENEVILSLADTLVHIPNLEEDIEYCFAINSVSTGGYGTSVSSEFACATPESPYGEQLEWGIQIVTEFIGFSGEELESDEYNLIGVDDAANDQLDELDFQEPPHFGNYVSLFFPHPEWGNFIGNQLIEKYTQDIRENVDLSSSVIEWNAQLETNTYGFPKLTFYFVNNAGGNTVYLFYNDTFQKIEDGQQVDLGYLGPGTRDDLQIIVGNAIPEPPINLVGEGNYREANIQWEDPCCQSGLKQYPAESFNIWRNSELVAESVLGTSYTDRGLDFSTFYTYEVSAVNIAGEGEKSAQVLELVTLENRLPIANAGKDLVYYDLINDGEINVDIILPFNDDFTNENKSIDPDNYYENNNEIFEYIPHLDDLSYSWSSASENEFEEATFSTQIGNLGLKGFELVVTDGESSSAPDSVYINIMEAPKPAKVDSIIATSDLYFINLQWIESHFTGESYMDLNNNGQWDNFEFFEDCGFDNLCPGDLGYTYPDEGEGTGTWEFDDINENGWHDFIDLNENGLWDEGEGEQFEYWDDVSNDGLWNDAEPFVDEPNDDGLYNGQYDGGNKPRPPYFGLSINDADDTFASYYKILRDDLPIVDVIDPQFANDGDLFDQFEIVDEDLEPSTEYCYKILACNFNDQCEYSDELCIFTKDRPSVTVVSPNGAEIIGRGTLDVELEFENVESINHLDLYISYSGDFEDDSQSQILISTDDIFTIYEDIDPSNIHGFSDEVKIRAQITDVGGYTFGDGGDLSQYMDENDNQFIITENQLDVDFQGGWHLFGSPLGMGGENLDDIINYSGINSGTWMAINQEGEYQDLSLNSGEGYYFWLLNSSNMLLNGDLYSQYDIPLEYGWNLISIPLIKSIDVGAFDIIDASGDLYSWGEAVENELVSDLLLGFDNDLATHIPSNLSEPFKGYWIYAHESSLILSVENKLDYTPEVNDDPSHWTLKLKSRAFGANAESFGDYIEVGFDESASNGFNKGEDAYHLPFNSLLQPYTLLKIDNSQWSDEYSLDSEHFMKDIQTSHDTLYVWNLIGESLNIHHPVSNPDNEVVLSWEMDGLSDDYSITLFVGEDPIDMRTQNGDQIKVSAEQFENLSIEVRLLNYVSGCSSSNACNYYCLTNIDCDGDQLPDNFYDDGSCDFDTCSGCSDESASNYNPHSVTEDLSGCEYIPSILLPLIEDNIYPEGEIVNRVPVNLYNYDEEYLYGIELQFNIDPDKVVVSDVDITNGIFGDGLASVNENEGINASYNLIWGYTSEAQDVLGIVIYATGDPINPGGISHIFDLIVDVTGNVGEQVTLDFQMSKLNLSDVNSNLIKLNIVKGLFEVEGQVQYYSDESIPVHDVDLDIVGISELTERDTSYTTFTNSSGQFNISQLLRGDYLSVINKTDNSVQGLSAVDASRIARHQIGLYSFTQEQLYAADADLNGDVNAFDAARIARYLVGIISQLNSQLLHWRFVPESNNNISTFDPSFISVLFDGNNNDILDFEYPLNWIFDPSLVDMDVLDSTEVMINALSEINSSDVEDYLNADGLSTIVENVDNQIITAYRIGDVDGDWYDDRERLSRESNDGHYQISGVDETIRIPLYKDDEALIEGVEIEITFDEEVLEFVGFDWESATISQNNFSLLENREWGLYNCLAFATQHPKNHNGILGYANFKLIEDVVTTIELSTNKINGVLDSNFGFKLYNDNMFDIVQSVDLSVNEIPQAFELSQNYPNPFNPTTAIPFALPEESLVNIKVYDIQGRLVSELLNEVVGIGYHQLDWDASSIASGVYFIKLDANSLNSNNTFNKTQKALLIK